MKIKNVSQKYVGQTQNSTNTHVLESLGNIFLTESLSTGYNTQITSEPIELDRQCPKPGVPRALLNRRNGTQKRDNRQSIGVIDRRRFVTTITGGEREREGTSPAPTRHG